MLRRRRRSHFHRCLEVGSSFPRLSKTLTWKGLGAAATANAEKKDEGKPSIFGGMGKISKLSVLLYSMVLDSSSFLIFLLTGMLPPSASEKSSIFGGLSELFQLFMDEITVIDISCCIWVSWMPKGSRLVSNFDLRQESNSVPVFVSQVLHIIRLHVRKPSLSWACRGFGDYPYLSSNNGNIDFRKGFLCQVINWRFGRVI